MEPASSSEDVFAQGRMREMTEAIELVTTWYDDVKRLETERLAQLLSLGAKVQKVLEMKDRLKALPGFGGRQKAASHDAKD